MLFDERLVARRLRIPRLEADDLDSERLGRVAGVRRDAETVGLLVVEDEQLRHPDVLEELRDGGALVRVVGHDARVVALAGRVVLSGSVSAHAGPASVRHG